VGSTMKVFYSDKPHIPLKLECFYSASWCKSRALSCNPLQSLRICAFCFNIVKNTHLEILVFLHLTTPVTEIVRTYHNHLFAALVPPNM